MKLCNYNKNIILLYASKILQILSLDKNQSTSGNYIIFVMGLSIFGFLRDGFGFGICRNQLNINSLKIVLAETLNSI